MDDGMNATDVVFVAAVAVAASVSFYYAIRWDRTCAGCSRRFPNAAERHQHERVAHSYR